MENFVNFYPTPQSLIEKMIEGIDWRKVQSVLEPEAGKGNIVDYIIEKSSSYPYYNKNLNVDCIELNKDLRKTLKGKEYSVVADDFLQFRTFKHYDLILMNPPFDRGCDHLLKAIELQERGGKIVCILNAETINNPCTLARQDLRMKLEKYNADISFSENEFQSAERKTSVAIAIVKIDIPRVEGESLIFERCKKAMMVRPSGVENVTDVAENDYIKAAVLRYEIEVAAGLELIREYKAMTPYILGSLKETSYNKPILRLKVDNHDVDENEFIELVRLKYWEALFEDERFTSGMTTDMISNYTQQINTLRGYDFSYFNIKEIQIQICDSLISGIETSIMKLFDDLSYSHSWYPECQNNIHYYNGWTTNKAWYVNRKVILPIHCYSDIWKEIRLDYGVTSKLRDIEKAFDYLAGTPGRNSFLCDTLSMASKEEAYKNIDTHYMTLTFYKKGTVHIIFKDLELLKKLNIFGGRGKNMLPPRYGKVPYEAMTPEEQNVVNEFDGGAEEYNIVYSNNASYLFDVKKDTVLQLVG